MRSAIRWTVDKVLTVLLGPEEECPDYPPTARVECPCDCGMTMGEVKWVVE